MADLIESIQESAKEGLERLVGLITNTRTQKQYSPNQLIDFYSKLYDLGTSYIANKKILTEKTQERGYIQLLSKLTDTPYDKINKELVKELNEYRRTLKKDGQRIIDLFNKIELCAYNQICLNTEIQNHDVPISKEQIVTAHSSLLDKTHVTYKNIRNNTYDMLIKAELV